MPNYEFICQDCRKRFEIFLTYAEYGKKEVTCPHCRSASVQRKIGRIRTLRSDESRLASLADPSNLEGLDDDPQALGRMLRTMRSEIGEEVGPEFGEVVDRLESGQTPQEIEQSMPDLGELAGGMSDAVDDF